jgi:O-antigen ligase
MSAGAARRWGERLGIAGLYALSLCAFLSPAGANLGLGLLALGVVLAPPGRGLLRQGAVVAALAFAVYVGLHTALYPVLGLGPRPDPETWDSAASWVQLLMLVPFAHFLAGDQGRLGRVLALALLGLIAGMLWRLDWGLLIDSPGAFFASRPGFGFPAIAFALYSGTAVLGLVLLAPRWWQSGGTAWAFKGLGWLVSLALLAQGLVATQSRGTWIAFALALAWALAIRPLLAPRPHPEGLGGPPGTTRQARLLWIALPLLAVSMLALNGERIAGRLAAELDSAAAVLRDSPGAPTGTSFALRWHALQFGIDRALERPLLGWGAGASHRLMDESADPRLKEEGQTLSHLHNAYVEILVQLGAIGALLAAAVILLLVRGVWTGVRCGRAPPDYGLFLISAFALTLIWSLWSYRAVHQDWRVFWVLLAGSALALAPPARPASAPPTLRSPST